MGVRSVLILLVIISTTYTSRGTQIIYVDVDGNDPGSGSFTDPFCRIQDAVNAASNGDIVEIREGIYTSPGNYDLDPNGKSITIRSTNPEDMNIVANTIIDPNRAGRGFYFHNYEDANCIVSGLTIQNGSSGFGGGILCQGSSPTIRSCIIRDNSAISPNPMLIPSYGGGLFCWDSNSQLIGCVISYNSADRGAGIEFWACQPVIINCIIVGNMASGTGSDAGGGGIEFCSMNKIRCNAILQNCTIAYNSSSSGTGGGILCNDSNAVVKNSILWGNEAQQGSQIAEPSWFGMSEHVSVEYCDVQGGSAAVYVGTKSTLDWSISNMDSEPNFVHFDPNGDPNMWDLHLQSAYGRWEPNSQDWVTDSNTSPCIDTGDPNLDWSCEPWPNGKLINIGAYGGTNQASMNGNAGDFDIDGAVDFEDFCGLAGKWGCEGSFIENLNNNGIVDFADLRIFVENWLWQQE